MAFAKADQAVPNFPELERRILRLWKDRAVFQRCLQQTAGKPEFVFYEGPPTANGLPHNGHVLTRVVKDLFPRYRTMRGYHVERRAGWDTHGLPVEVEVEKELRISGREAILAYGVDRFARKCLESVFRYTAEWEHLTERIGFWVDLETAYVTFHKPYIESVWWALAQLFAKGLLYKGHKVVWWWAQGGTALSAGEVGNSYKTVDDPSVYVRFPLRGEDASLVIWTTTPWTLPSNMFVAVQPEFEYAYVQDATGGPTLVLAKALVAALAEKSKRDLRIVKVVPGKELVGKRYTPPFPTYAAEAADDARYFRVLEGNRASSGTPQWFVTLDAGTGIVHLAPAFGDDDFRVWRRQQQQDPDLALFCAVKPDGKFDARLQALGLEGVWVKDADKPLLAALKAAGLLVHHELIRHEYPFCWRSDQDPLIQYAREAWFIRTTSQAERMIANNQAITWQPPHIRDGRFGDFLAGNVDWALSRERFWGTPLNVWECPQCGQAETPDSCAAIERRNPQAFAAFHAARRTDPTLSEHLMVHKPWIDAVTFPCAQCQAPMRRVPEVIDCWFDSGCMPFAQLGYPHASGSEAALRQSFPADFISEAIDQTRGWFYSLLAVSTLVFDRAPPPHPYKRCIVLGHVLDKAGKKESKSSGNYTPPEVIIDAVRMEFAPLALDAPRAKGATAPKTGEAWIGREDLEGLDLAEGARVILSRGQTPANARPVVLRVHKTLPRRVLILAEADRTALGLQYGPADVRPAEVPKLPADQRVMVTVDTAAAPGADALRWFFYASNPPWNSTRHSLANVRLEQRELPIKLRNVFAFFVTYANIDQFAPTQDAAQQRPVAQRAPLDRWIISELERAKRSTIRHLDAFESYEAATALSAFVEGLSNWYVRRSRDRFWAAGRGQDKLDAYWTLYECLRDLTLLLAPFLPFGSEDMYQTLVADQGVAGMPDSVHLARFPEPNPALIDEPLSRDMNEVRDLVTVGLQVRNAHKLKVRQPLREAAIVLADPARTTALQAYAAVMAEELNVKSIRFVPMADELVDYRIKPNLVTLGKRLGAKLKATQQVLAEQAPAALKRQLDADGQVRLAVAGEDVCLTREDVLVAVEAKPGFAAASGTAGVVVLDTKLDQGLRDEGLFREVLSRVQARRKDLQLDYDARIRLGLSGSARLLEVCRARAAELEHETLTAKLVLGGPVGGEPTEVTVDGETLVIDVAV